MAPNIDLSDGMIKFEIEYQVHCECGNGLLTESEWEGGMLMITATPCEECTESSDGGGS